MVWVANATLQRLNEKNDPDRAVLHAFLKFPAFFDLEMRDPLCKVSLMVPQSLLDDCWKRNLEVQTKMEGYKALTQYMQISLNE